MKQKTYGYARVSSKDQNEARQLDALTEYPIPLENIFIDKKSGKDFERPAWHQMLTRVHEGGPADRSGEPELVLYRPPAAPAVRPSPVGHTGAGPTVPESPSPRD